MTASAQPILVGVDGSQHSFAAASWAAREAGRRQAVLHLVLAGDPARADYAEETVHAVAARCRRAWPDLEITEEVVLSHPVDALVLRSSKAEMVVVGSRGRGGFMNALLGAVSAAVAAHSECPVVVVRGQDTAGPVVVGVDGSAGSRAALEFAFETCALRGADLRVVQALPKSPPTELDPHEAQGRAQRELSGWLASWCQRYPQVAARALTPRTHPVAALRDAASDAQLLVVGQTGCEGFIGALLGSVAAGALQHAPCPVAVVRGSNGSREQ